MVTREHEDTLNVFPVNTCEICSALMEEPDNVSVTPTLGWFGFKLNKGCGYWVEGLIFTLF